MTEKVSPAESLAEKVKLEQRLSLGTGADTRSSCHILCVSKHFTSLLKQQTAQFVEALRLLY
jgi:hypothetical protein